MLKKEAAKNFGVSLATIKPYLKLRRETEGVIPKPIPWLTLRKELCCWPTSLAAARNKVHPTVSEYKKKQLEHYVERRKTKRSKAEGVSPATAA